jgi:hypothetical protein
MPPDFIIVNLGRILNVRVCTEAAAEWVGENLEIGVEDVVENHRPGSEYTFRVDHLRGWKVVDLLEDSGRFIVEVQNSDGTPVGNALRLLSTGSAPK